MEEKVWIIVYPGIEFMLASSESPSVSWGSAQNHSERGMLLVPGRGTKSSENAAKTDILLVQFTSGDT